MIVSFIIFALQLYFCIFLDYLCICCVSFDHNASAINCYGFLNNFIKDFYGFRYQDNTSLKGRLNKHVKIAYRFNLVLYFFFYSKASDSVLPYLPGKLLYISAI